MPDEDPGDVFLRHRGVVLDALLSDPVFGQSSVATRENPEQPEYSAATFAIPDLDEEPEVSAPRRRTGDGPRASERILALLNGQSQDSTPAMDYAADYSAVAAKANAPAEPEPEPERPASTPADRLAPAKQIGRDALTQLRKPKVALAVGAVVAVLLVLLLITTGGQEKDTAQDQLRSSPCRRPRRHPRLRPLHRRAL